MNDEFTAEWLEAYYKTHPEQRPTHDNGVGKGNIIAQWDKKPAPATSKYRARRTNGYASKKEAEFAAQLAIRQKAGEVWFWLESDKTIVEVAFRLSGIVQVRRRREFPTDRTMADILQNELRNLDFIFW